MRTAVRPCASVASRSAQGKRGPLSRPSWSLIEERLLLDEECSNSARAARAELKRAQ
jgi:hypothetical protein